MSFNSTPSIRGYLQKDMTPTKVANLWRDYASPLRYLTKNNIRQMLDQARHGNDTRLQIAFYEMERTMPIFGIVIQRRLAGIQNKKWIIECEDEDVKEYLETFLINSDSKNRKSLSECIRHLTLGNFRGRSVVKPYINFDKEDIDFYPIDNWNVLNWNNHLYWCPKGTDFLPDLNNKLPDDVVEIPNDEVLWINEERPIDIPGIEIYLRQLVGEDGWSRATEKYGVAQVILKTPEGTPDSALPIWAERAARITEGGFGVLPNGSEVDQLTDARGQDPFSEYVKHQTEMIVTLACGSTLGTIAGSTGLGSGLAETQENVFNSLVNYDCKRIANEINGVLIKKILKKINYKGFAQFSFVLEDTKDESEKILNYAKIAKDMGYTIDLDELKRVAPKLSFIKKESEIDTTSTINESSKSSISSISSIDEWSPQDN